MLATIMRMEKVPENAELPTKKLLVSMVPIPKTLDEEDRLPEPHKQQICRISQQDGGYWVFHKNKVDLTSVFS